METNIRIEGPEINAKLAALDARYPGLYSRRLLIFKPSGMNKDKIIEVLKEGVKRLVQQIPILAGTVVAPTNEPGKQKGWGSIEKGPRLPLKIKDASSELNISALEEENIRPDDLPDSLLVPIAGELSKPPYPACELQLTFAADAAILAICIAHMVGDGPAMTTIVSLLAKHCRKVQEGDTSPEPQTGLDRSPYTNLNGPLNKLEDHPAYTQHRDTSGPPAGYTAPENSDIVTKIYTISSENLAKLKESATSDTRISTHDALSALIWRSIMLNRLASKTLTLEDTPETSYFVAVNTRRHMELPSTYIGNTVYQTHTTLPLSTLLKDTNLTTATKAIREAINFVNKDVVSSLLGLFGAVEDIKSIQWRGPALSLTRDIVGMSFYHSEEMYTDDWGEVFGGHVERMRCSDLGFTGSMRGTHYVMPLQKGRGCEVQLSLERSGIGAMEGDEVFKKWFSEGWLG